MTNQRIDPQQLRDLVKQQQYDRTATKINNKSLGGQVVDFGRGVLGSVPNTAVGIYQLLGDIAPRLLGAGKDYLEGDNVTLGESIGIEDTVRSQSVAARKAINNFLGLTSDEDGFAVGDAAMAGDIIGGILLPAGLLTKAAAPVIKGSNLLARGARGGMHVLDELLTTSTNKYVKAGLGLGLPLAANMYTEPSRTMDVSNPEAIQPMDAAELRNLVSQTTDDREKEQGFWSENWGKVAGATAVAGLIAASIRGKSLRSTLNALNPEQISKNSELGLSTAARQGMFDPTAGITQAAKKLGGTEDDVSRIQSKAHISVAQGTAQTTAANWYRTGIIEGTDIKTPSLQELRATFNGAFSDAEKASFDEYAKLASNISDMRVFGANADPLRRKELLDRFAQLSQDPKNAQLLGQFREMTRGLAQYMVKEGLLPANRLATYNNPEFFYYPLMIAEDLDPLSKAKNLVLGMSKQKSDNDLITQLFDRQPTAYDIPGQINIFDAMDVYAQNVVGFARRNNVRQEFVRVWEQAKTKRGMMGLANRIMQKVDRPGEDTFTLLRDGEKSYYKVNDAVLKPSLIRNPAQAGTALSAMNQVRQLQQNAFTGAFNPLFAIQSVVMDVLGGATTLSKGYKLGQFSGDTLTPLLYEVPMGFYHGMYGKVQRGLMTHLRFSIAKDGVLYRALNSVKPGLAGKLADSMASAYANSILYKIESRGGISAGHLVDIGDAKQFKSVADAIDGVAAEGNIRGGARSLWNSYKAVLETAHNSARLGFFARNYRPGMSEDALNSLIVETRKLSGDFGVAGTNMETFKRTVLYGNVAAQAMVRNYDAIKANPIKWTQRFVTGIMLPAAATAVIMSMDEDNRDWYWNKLSPEDRNNLTFKLPNGQVMQLRIPGEYRPAVAMLHAGLDSMFGLSSGALSRNTQVRDQVLASLGLDYTGELAEQRNKLDLLSAMQNFSPIGGNPLGSVAGLEPGLALLGQEPTPNIFQGVMRPIYTSQTGAETPGMLGWGVGTLPNDVISANAQYFLTSLFGQIASTSIDIARTVAFGYGSKDVAELSNDIDEVFQLGLARSLTVAPGLIHPEAIRQRQNTATADLSRTSQTQFARLQTLVSEASNQRGVLQTGPYAAQASPELQKFFVDPLMENLAQTAVGNLQGVDYNYWKRISFLRSQKEEIARSGKLSPGKKAEMQNDLDDQIFELQDQANRVVNDLEYTLSMQVFQATGLRKKITIGDIDKDKSVLDLPSF